MKAIWTGSISFGLVNIPVKLFSGSESNALDLNLLHKTDLHPINYIKVCKAENKEVPMSEIVKGYQHASGEYIVLTEQDFENASVEKTHLIDILDFVEEHEIDSRYFERPYYLEPDKTGAKPYALLREALKKSGKVGIASYVLRNRGSIGVVKPLDDVLVLNQMRYQEEVRSHAELKVPQAENIRQQEIDLALMLIERYTTTFDPAKYKDSYIDDLRRIIEEKAQGIQPQPQGKRPQPTNVVDMMALLKKSLEEKKRKAA
ncbi:Ku protein [Geotalea sp. SG265]|uniref:non-homologous end joining protein Ku n=1 Tax=Geotalea sp. SG265 TaxID=2922867 RepID=UPI001FAEE40A|nr:Ku protein [Geotalea sp. SG265]